MKGTTVICLLLTLILLVMGVQTYGLFQKTQALETEMAGLLDELADMKTSIRAVAETSERINAVFGRLAEDGGLFGWLKQASGI